eukprot:gene9849-10859_t
MVVKQKDVIQTLKPQNEYVEIFLAKFNSSNKDVSLNTGGEGSEHEEDGVGIEGNGRNTLRNSRLLLHESSSEEKHIGEISQNVFKTMTRTRKKTSEPKVLTYGRGRPRKRSFARKYGNSNDKQSQDGSESGEGRSNRNRQRGNGAGSGGSQVDEPDLTPEQEAEMAQELLSLIPPKHMNCDPAERPAKPGTAVDLHGIVLHETTGGLVVLNVRWRNKIYSGALIDVRKSKWAFEKIKPDPYPESANPRPADMMYVGGGTKRKAKKLSNDENEKEIMKKITEQQTEQAFKEPIGLPLTFKRQPDPSTGNDNNDSNGRKKARLSPPLIECPEPNCGKKYSHKNGLKYHQAHAHQKKDDNDDKVTTSKATTSDAESVRDAQKSESEDDQMAVSTTESKDNIQLDVVGSLDDSNPANDASSQLISVCSDKDTAQTTQSMPQIVPQSMPQIVPQIMPQPLSQIVQLSVPSLIPQSLPQAMSQALAHETKSAVAQNASQVVPVVPQIVVKTEDESAVDSIKDVDFENAAKENQRTTESEKDVTTIILASSNVEEVRSSPLFSTGNSVGLPPFTSRGSLSFPQSSPTLASLNPQMLNNSLSNALQTVSFKSSEEKKYAKEEREDGEEDEEDVQNEEDVNPEEDDFRPNLELNFSESMNSASNHGNKSLTSSKEVKNEDIVVPSSPDDLIPSSTLADILPESFGLHLYQQKDNESRSNNNQTIISPPATVTQPWNKDAISFPSSLFSVSLYNQICQEQASRSFHAADSVTGDLAEPSDIQKAISQVDVRRHFSPMLLNYLNAGSRVKECKSVEGESSVADAVFTSETINYNAAKSTQKMEAKESVVSTSSFSLSPRPESIKREKFNENRSTPVSLPTKPEFLQPNISAGRPICRPVTKQERITGGVKMQGNMQRYNNNSNQTSSIADSRSDDVTQSSLFLSTCSADVTNTQLTGKQGIYAQPSTSSYAGDVSHSSYLDKIEAKTWVPQEVYRQPMKSMSGQEKKDQSSLRIGLDMPCKIPFTTLHVNDETKQSEKQNITIKKDRQDSNNQPYHHTIIASSSDSDKIILDDSSNDKDVSVEGPDPSRFTLTSEGLVSSPADIRGRPRKIRVEKTQQIPVGNAKDVETSRVIPEHNPRKQALSTYTRSSVIHSMATPPEEPRMGVTVKEEYISPDGKRKGSPRLQDRQLFDKKLKQDYKKTEANRVFEAEREKLKNRHVESHYANEVRNLHLRANELPSSVKSDMAMRRSVSPAGLTRMPNHPSTDKMDRHSREKFESKGIPMSPAFGQSSQFHPHPHASSEIDKLRSEYMQHDISRIPVPFGGSLLPSSAEGYPGLPTSFPSTSFFGHSGHRSIPSQRFDQIVDQDKAYAKYTAEKSELGFKHAHESSKMATQDRMRVSSRDHHSHRSPYYHQASPLGYQSRESASGPTRSPKSSPFGYRPGDIFSTSRSQRIDNEAQVKDTKPNPGDNRREIRRDYGMPPYTAPFYQAPFQYPSISSNVTPKSYSQRMSEQRSPYKHASDVEKNRYQPHPGNQPQSGPGGLLSANLVLTKADSLGFSSMPYDNRNAEGKK